MEQTSLQALLESDREMILSNIGKDRTPAAAQAMLEKAMDRVMYRYVEQCADVQLRDAAQYILQSMKNTLPVMDVVEEARSWKRDAAGGNRREHGLRPAALAVLILGAALVLAAVVAGLITGGLVGPLGYLKSLLPAALGAAALFWAGRMSVKSKKSAAAAQEETRTEFLVDAEKAFHRLRGALMLADRQLETIREDSAAQRRSEAERAGAPIPRQEIDLFAELLEAALASEGEGAKEMISSIRFYLHNSGVETVEFAPGRENWFEFLPASKPGTLRPALVHEGKLLKKGLASAAE